MKITPVVLIAIWLSLFTTGKSFSCTILYWEKEGIILAGNNEDWKDPLTKMWIYPPGAGKHGWIKFGFGSGFPQGGMNDRGLFWDATAGPHMEMPYSESNKTLYDGVLMQKVIEESADVAEAEAILQAYYSQDQYRAQYLIGDALGSSMISEGDSIIKKQVDYQVLTNFYQSDPDLGGYPCWRYNTATELLGGYDKVTAYNVGTILASTHQEGKYPTQYSNIYDLQAKRIYLFYYHNYEEFLVINLQAEMEKGEQSHDIPSIFSQVDLLSPGHGDTITGNHANISWMGLPGCEYRIIYDTDPDLSDPESVEAPYGSGSQKNNALLAIILPLFVLVPLLRKRRIRTGMVLFLMAVTVTGIHCENDEDPGENQSAVEQSAALKNLESNTTYYWRIEATNSKSGYFSTETIIQSFRTSSH